MSLGLLLPAGLFALVALSLPLLLHLTRRTEQRPTMFAALRWLRVRQRPRRQLRLEELLLLTLRLLLLAALAVLLAQPVLYGATGRQPWVVVAPGIDRDAARAALAAPGAEWRWLAPRFPALDRDPPAGPQPVSSLLRELDATLRADVPLTVVVLSQLAGLDGERPALRRTVDWRVIETPGIAMPAAQATPISLAVRHAPGDEPALRYLRAAAAAWAAVADTNAADAVRIDVAPASDPVGTDADWLVWLAPDELPPGVRSWIVAGGIALLGARTTAPETAAGITLWRDAQGETLVRGSALGNGRVMQLMREPTPAQLPELLDPDFPDRLRMLFDRSPPPDRALAETHEPLPGGPAMPPLPRPLQSWLALLVATLFLAERWLATAQRSKDAT